MATNLYKLNLWSLDDSNKIIVDICKNTPIIIAVISVLYLINVVKFSPAKLPKGDIKENKIRNEIAVFLLNLEFTTNVPNIIAIGIL